LVHTVPLIEGDDTNSRLIALHNKKTGTLTRDLWDGTLKLVARPGATNVPSHLLRAEQLDDHRAVF
jgi:hypothetical protein